MRHPGLPQWNWLDLLLLLLAPGVSLVGDGGGLPDEDADMLRLISERDLFGEDLKTSISFATACLLLQLKILDFVE